MKFLVNTGQMFRDTIIRGRLVDLGYQAVQVHGNDYEKHVNGEPVGLYIYDNDRNVAALKAIRFGESSINPFAPVTIISHNPSDFLRGFIGVSVVHAETFTIYSIDEAVQVMVWPENEFIIIPNVYMGPERRKVAQERPFERRMGYHKLERRYCPIKTNNGMLEWKKTASGHELQAKLKDFHKELETTADKKSCVMRLVEELKAWHFTPERILDVTGVKVS